MAEYLDMGDQVIRQRLENAMQQWERLAEIQIQQFHARLDGLLFHHQQRVTEIAWRSEGLPLTPVERQDGLSAKDFRRKYLSKGIPVILENGAAGWPLARWSFDGFRQRYGREMIKLVQRRGVAADEEIVSGREYDTREGAVEAFELLVRNDSGVS